MMRDAARRGAGSLFSEHPPEEALDAWAGMVRAATQATQINLRHLSAQEEEAFVRALLEQFDSLSEDHNLSERLLRNSWFRRKLRLD
jgi:hypothetical protein